MRPLPVFLVVAFGLAWVAALPVWLAGGLGSPMTQVSGMLMMFTPSVGVLAAWLLTGRAAGSGTGEAVGRPPFRRFARETGLTLGERPGRTVLLVLLAWFGVPLLVAASIALSVALGLVSLDLTRFSLFQQGLRAQGAQVPGGLSTVVVIQILIATLAGPLLNAVPSLGEEWGWRGWLAPRLVAARGTVAGLALSGVVWGLWHAPLTLLGYNYARLGPWAALYFVGFCVPAGVVFGWLRLRSGSVWPAVVAHGSVNAVTGVVLLLGDAAAPPDPVVAGLTGLAGWAVLAVTAVVLLRFFPVRAPRPPCFPVPEPDPAGAPAAG
ncbi:CPBP family intramembrane glutamic endopeptidase [Nonomuraea roseoviolacea]|uniref:Membrane protease YdiL (CAAX protease family) n=1 Tax=Nonomuraea roseoviolacea subsp. carminata TaxID=160689 RepID=A0ABT1JT77_9ACTN|nr:type II CAAX endopeptidase family protein [Nonomuraea roseoviolacea]MCP2344481.1 membrane protease YdiL (CAAX protease family) [Nonomuraea roseoviolacea subsp. carminata]